MTAPKNRDVFLAYCRDYSGYKPREKRLHKRTLSRYLRGLQLVEKILGHDLETVTEADQLIFMEGIMKYKQGTRRVSTQIFQRYIAWGIKNGSLSCDNLIIGNEDTIIGENTKVSYTYIPKIAVKRFFMKLKNPQLRMVFSLFYYGGLTTAELESLGVDNITKDGLLVYRTVRRESQIIPLPRLLMQELREYANTRTDLLFDLGEDQVARRRINKWYKAAQVDTGELLGTTVRDLRTTAIRHFFELSSNIEQTKEFAGVSDTKKGWIEDLVDASSHYMKNIAKARSYHGSAEKQLESG